MMRRLLAIIAGLGLSLATPWLPAVPARSRAHAHARGSNAATRRAAKRRRNIAKRQPLRRR